MTEFCQQIPVSIEQLLRLAFHIRNLKRSTIEQLIDHEEKSLHVNRYHSRTDENNSNPNNNNNNNNNNASINNLNNIERQAAFVTHQHLTRIPKTSILDHQQVVFSN